MSQLLRRPAPSAAPAGSASSYAVRTRDLQHPPFSAPPGAKRLAPVRRPGRRICSSSSPSSSWPPRRQRDQSNPPGRQAGAKAGNKAEERTGRQIPEHNPSRRSNRPEGGGGGKGPTERGVESSGSIRINKCFRHLASRRQADQFVEEGRVEVDGKLAEPGCRVTPGAIVTLNGRLVDWERLNILEEFKPGASSNPGTSPPPRPPLPFLNHPSPPLATLRPPLPFSFLMPNPSLPPASHACALSSPFLFLPLSAFSLLTPMTPVPCSPPLPLLPRSSTGKPR